MLILHRHQGFDQQVGQLFPFIDYTIFIFQGMETANAGWINPRQSQISTGIGARDFLDGGPGKLDGNAC